MNVLGLTIQRTKSLAALSSVPGSRGWIPWIQELTTGGWQRNEDVQVDTVLSNPTLYACVTLIAGDIAKLRPKLVEQDTDGIWHEVEIPAFSPVLRKPNGYQTRIDFFEWWMLSKLNHGNTYVLKERDGRGVVRAMHILDPYRVRPLVSPDGSVFYQLFFDVLAQQLKDSVVVPAREIIHDVMCPLFHPLVGVSPIYAAGFAAMQGLNIRRSSDKFFTNGSRPGGVLLVPGEINETQAAALKAQWDTAFSGDNTGKIAVLTGNMKYEPMAQTAEQSRLVEQLNLTDEDIAKCFHMPRHKVGIGPDPTYSNIEALNKMYYSDCLQKPIEKLELNLDEGIELTTVVGRRLGVEFDRDALFEMDTSAKASAATQAVGAGMSFNEVRRRYWDLGPVEGGESPLAQQQYYSIQALSRRDALMPAPATPQGDLPPDDEEDDMPSDGLPEKQIQAAQLCLMVQRKIMELQGA